MKKVLSILLTIVMLFTMVPASVFAADGITVNLVSFMRGDVTDLRSSELLEVQVKGYDGNPRELTYKWTSSLGTYLYVYNSHNMYGINNTDGEREIYNSAKKISNKNMTGSTSMAGRTYDKTFKEVGFAWAAVYGADLKDNQLNGTVTVEVFDKNGKSLGSDSYTNFKDYNLKSDIENVVIGLFEGDRMDVRDLLGQSGVVHITCSASSVSSAKVEKGGEYIAVESEYVDRNTYNYYVKGVKAGTNSTNGDAQLYIKIAKDYCKFHAYTDGTANPVVYVFQKPVTETTTTTLTLVDKIDGRCEYFINGNKGEKQPDGTILFTGLTPNTTYTVEVRAEYDDKGTTKYVYGYVEDTTKPVYKATVKTYLDNTITDISDIHGEEVTLYLGKNAQVKDFISLSKTAVGTYEAVVENGTYFPWHYENGTYHQARNYELIIEHANAELSLHHYSVNYNTNGGSFKAGEEVATEIYSSMNPVNATSNVPVREGYIFTGWEYNGATYASGAEITASISSPIILAAKWEKAVNVTINVVINHEYSKTDIDGNEINGYDQNKNKDKLVVDFLEMKKDSPAFIETGDRLNFTKEGVTDGKESPKTYDYNIAHTKFVTTYTAKAAAYTGLLESSTFGVSISKSGYDVEEIIKTKDNNGNWIIDIKLAYNPDDFDVDFSIAMDKDVPQELYPDAVIVKLAYWDKDLKEWKIISPQESIDNVIKPGVRVDIDPVTGEGSGSYPVWKYDGDNKVYGYRAVVTGFIYDGTTIIVPTEKDHTKDDNTVIVTYTDGNYTATMSDIADGKKFSTSLNGAYYNSATNAQQGTRHGVITVEKYDVIFDANDGEINGADTYTEADEYYVPDTSKYVPTFDGHEFIGWYKDPQFKEPAVSGELLTENITLYAKWDQILTGNVRVAGYYMQNGEIVDVWAVDRADSAVVVLQEITDTGVYNIDRKTVKIVWPMSDTIYGVSEEYKFTGLDPSKTYRTEVLVLNYGTTYQNSTTVVDDDDEYSDDFNATDYKAVYPESSKWSTFVNAYLSFVPASYFQPVEVDATLIGANLRPEDTLVQVWYKATGTDNAYQVISQHTVVPYGIEVGMAADGMDDGYYGYLVWNSLHNGNLYDYQAYLDKIDGDAVSDWPVSVVYGAPSRYSPLNDAATGALQVKLIPNRYNIIYNENYTIDDVNVVSNGTHIWSYETAITYVPVRDGYVFQGWYNNPECTGDKVTAIAETVAEHTNLYAKWEERTGLELRVNYVEKLTDSVLDTEINAYTFNDVVTAESLKKEFAGFSYDSASAESVTIGTVKNEITLYYVRNNYNYTVNYLEEGTDKVLATAKSESAVYGATVTENAIVIDGYTLTGSDKKSITINTENNVIDFYYAADNFGGGTGGNESDGTPDKYQKKVTFKVVNGIWTNGTADDIVLILTLVKDGKFAIDGTATLIAPVGMVPNIGYEGGSWDVTPPEVVSGTNEEAYTYTFTEVVPEIPEEPEEPDTPDTPDIPDTPDTPDTPDIPDTPDTPETPDDGGSGSGSADRTHNIVFGKTNSIGWYNVSLDGGQTYKMVFGNSTLEVEEGTEMIIKAGDLVGGSFTFYVNGNAVKPDENGEIRVVVDGYMLIGALSIEVEIPDVEESLNWFQKLIKAIKEFFAKLFGKK